MVSINFGTPAEYYRALKNLNTKESQMTKDYKIPLPRNLEQIIGEADRAVMSEDIDSLTKKGFKEAFVIFNSVMTTIFKNKIVGARRKSLNAIRENAKQNGHHMSVKSKNASAAKVSREDCIPDALLDCKSNVAKAAVAMFLIHTSKETLRKKALYHILAGKCESMDEVIDLMKFAKEEIRKLNPEEPNTDMQTLIIQALMGLADIVRDKTHAKFAIMINEQIYIAAVTHYIEKDVFHTIFPYDAVVSRYLKECVAPISMDVEHESIQNQFKVDPKSIITYMLKSLPSSVRVKRQTKSVRFDEKTIYEVFKGPTNYNLNLMVTNINYENKMYRIITYNDCLYDVIGSTVEHNTNGVALRDSVIYNNMRWSERLSILPYRARIDLEKMTGAELNDYKKNATMNISWMDSNGFECSKTFHFRTESKHTKIVETSNE